MRPQTIGLIAHTGKARSADLVRAVGDELERAELRVLIENATAELVGKTSDHSVPDLARESDLLVVLGGDGTILNTVRQLGDEMKPIFGINVGTLGFLTCAPAAGCVEAVRCIAAGQMTFSDRSLLEVTTNERGEQRITTGLNDAVLSRGAVSRLIRLRTRVNGEELTEFNADGLIIATPTGSTAYSLSAGGPILTPDSGALVITPICPHVLTNRSIIVGENSVIDVAAQPDHLIYLTVDGGQPMELDPGAVVTIRKSERILPLASMPGVSFFSVVRQKLKWSGSNV
ncbi:MAG TPA: NAD(+)/NADH kinase [Chthoniobacterales bacterium]|nr:NAD(+)/NADH kinase [Chthoniobacterales bacterium]